MDSIFPLIKRFDDIKSAPTTVILKEETVIHEKYFRTGTIFSILGWREINEKAYLVITKGSWEGLIDYEEYATRLEKIV